VKTITVFVLPGKPVCRVCEKKHREGHRCKRWHYIHEKAIWSGVIPLSEEGQFRVEVHEHRERVRKLHSKWKRMLVKTQALAARAAPAFKAYALSLVEKHKAEEPKLDIGGLRCLQVTAMSA
jgi:hypothetical protein